MYVNHYRFNDSTPKCQTISSPSNTRLTTDTSKRTPLKLFDNEFQCTDIFLSCNEPNDKSLFGGVESDLKLRTLPAGMNGHQLSLHYICGIVFTLSCKRFELNRSLKVEILLRLVTLKFILKKSQLQVIQNLCFGP